MIRSRWTPRRRTEKICSCNAATRDDEIHHVEAGYPQERQQRKEEHVLRQAFVHETRNMSGVVDGDDFVWEGIDEDLDWVRKVLEDKYELKNRDRLGFGRSTCWVASSSSLMRESLGRGIRGTLTCCRSISGWMTCEEYISNYRKLATKTVYLQHEQQHER